MHELSKVSKQSQSSHSSAVAFLVVVLVAPAWIHRMEIGGVYVARKQRVTAIYSSVKDADRRSRTIRSSKSADQFVDILALLKIRKRINSCCNLSHTSKLGNDIEYVE